VFPDDGGQWRIALHAWTPPTIGYDQGGARSLWIGRFSFEDRRPRLESSGN
jgi:hypothetical protein